MKYREKNFSISHEISQEVLCGKWQYWSNVGALTAASLFVPFLFLFFIILFSFFLFFNEVCKRLFGWGTSEYKKIILGILTQYKQPTRCNLVTEFIIPLVH